MGDDDLCKGCDSTCQECADDVCSLCIPGLYLDANSQCVDDCGESHYNDDTTCHACSTGCLWCQMHYADGEMCFECERGYQ